MRRMLATIATFAVAACSDATSQSGEQKSSAPVTSDRAHRVEREGEPAVTAVSAPATAEHGSGRRYPGDETRDTTGLFGSKAVLTSARVKVRAPTVKGPFHPEKIAWTFANCLPEAVRCYEEELKSAPRRLSELVVDFTIERDGTVKKSSSTGDLGERARECVVEKVRKLRFENPDKELSEVRYPLTFYPGNPLKARVDGVEVTRLSEKDLRSSLGRRSCVDIGPIPKPKPLNAVSWQAKCGADTFTIVYRLYKGDLYQDGMTSLSLRGDSRWFEAEDFLLAISRTDDKAAKKLLDSLLEP